MSPALLSRARAEAASGRRSGVAVHLVDVSAGPAEVARAEGDLVPGELARARRGTPQVHARRVLLRSALRRALAAELGVPPRGVPLSATAAGRPYVRGAAVDASCSASAAVGIVVVARRRRVGVDVERVTPCTALLLDDGWLADSELRALAALPSAARAEAAARAWTRKEAVLKARGTGLLADPRTVVTPVGRAAGVIAGWAVDDLPVPPGWVASLALGPLEEIPA